MGSEGGIDEIWAHPFMAIKDFNTRIQFKGNDTLIALNELVPEIQVCPECFIRLYRIGNAILKEVITVSPDKPRGDGSSLRILRFFVSLALCFSYHSNIRLMWPYSEDVLKQYQYSVYQ